MISIILIVVVVSSFVLSHVFLAILRSNARKDDLLEMYQTLAERSYLYELSSLKDGVIKFKRTFCKYNRKFSSRADATIEFIEARIKNNT